MADMDTVARGRRNLWIYEHRSGRWTPTQTLSVTLGEVVDS